MEGTKTAARRERVSIDEEQHVTWELALGKAD